MEPLTLEELKTLLSEAQQAGDQLSTEDLNSKIAAFSNGAASSLDELARLVDLTDIREIFADARSIRGDIPTEDLNAKIVELTNGRARNMQSLAQLVGEQQEQVTSDETPSLGKAAGTLQAFGQGLSFNTLDEISGLIGGPEEAASVKGQGEQFREEHPVLSIGGEIAGAVVPSLAGGLGAARLAPNLARAAVNTGTRRLGTGILAGAAEGALSEAGRAESGERGKGALLGAGLGAAGGGVGGVVAPVLGKLGSAALRRTPTAVKRRATRLVGNIVEKAGEGKAGIERLLGRANRVGGQTGDEVKLLDLVGSELGDVAEADAAALRQAQQILTDRAERAPARIRQQGDFALGVEDTAGELRQAAAQQRAATRQAYDALSEDDKLFPVLALGDKVTVPVPDVPGPPNTLLDFQGIGVTTPGAPVPAPPKLRPAISEAMTDAAKKRANAGDAALPDGMLDFDGMQNVKISLDDQISAAYSAGRPGHARELRVVRDDFIEAMNATFEEFAPTQALFAGSRQLDDAIAQGRRIGSKPHLEIEDDLLRIGDDPVLMRGYRAGASEAIGEATARQTNPTKIFNEGLRGKIDLIAPEGSDLNRLDRALDLEGDLAKAKVPDQPRRQPAAERAIADRPFARAADPSGRGTTGGGSLTPRAFGFFGGFNQQGFLTPGATTATAAQRTARRQVGLLGEPLTAGSAATQEAGRRSGLLSNIGTTVAQTTPAERLLGASGLLSNFLGSDQQ